MSTTMSTSSTNSPATSAHARTSTSRRSASRSKHPSDDEILGLVTSVARPASSADAESAAKAHSDASGAGTGEAETRTTGQVSAPQPENASAASAISPEVAQIVEAHPEIRDAIESAQQFRAVFPTPAAAQDAKTQLEELDAMFFSGAPADHAALAAHIHELSPGSFHALAQALQAHAAKLAAQSAAQAAPSEQSAAPAPASASASDLKEAASSPADAPTTAHLPANATAVGPDAAHGGAAGAAEKATASAGEVQSAPAAPAQTSDAQRVAQLAFFHSANAAAVRQIVSAIESHVNRLLPESVSAGTKTRIVGEIYRDLGATLGANRQLAKQLRDAFASGVGQGLQAGQAGPANANSARMGTENAVVALLVGRAKQALPSIAKRVISEWTHGVVAANRERLARHESAAKRVDIAGSAGSDGVNRKPVSPRDVDYKRLSDADILNL